MSDEPRGEVEIIPPGEEPRRSHEDGFASSRIWISSGSGDVKFVRLGPLQSMMLGVGLLLFIGLCLFFLSGLLLILVPAVALIGAAAWVANALGFGPFRRLR
ncbi:hypothetical protein [Methylocystis parvus]|uniref:Uncharacterized protein n=1 Tax=Methylocystis parvus TaxID=134 RepID=A0A6B8M8Q0_9HYPH|nr:hypothetical protein [Methylocystis parvus]QGM97090.1 hypothetical protein F7D14_06120 [Methylocystis parvus]WBJ99007.1 hypothetical protein MMG94_13490 [Methylocystis parvus OBBP]